MFESQNGLYCMYQEEGYIDDLAYLRASQRKEETTGYLRDTAKKKNVSSCHRGRFRQLLRIPSGPYLMALKTPFGVGVRMRAGRGGRW